MMIARSEIFASLPLGSEATGIVSTIGIAAVGRRGLPVEIDR